MSLLSLFLLMGLALANHAQPVLQPGTYATPSWRCSVTVLDSSPEYIRMVEESDPSRGLICPTAGQTLTFHAVGPGLFQSEQLANVGVVLLNRGEFYAYAGNGRFAYFLVRPALPLQEPQHHRHHRQDNEGWQQEPPPTKGNEEYIPEEEYEEEENRNEEFAPQREHSDRRAKRRVPFYDDELPQREKKKKEDKRRVFE